MSRKRPSSFQLLHLLTSLPLLHATTMMRSLTSESSTATAVMEFNLRSDSTIKIKHKCPNLNYILGPIHDADTDQNGVLNKEEYVQFADTVSGGWLSSNDRSDSFLDMPLQLQETYVVLSCLCELYQSEPPPWGGKGCCTNDYFGSGNSHIGIRTNGTAEDEELTKVQSDYFKYVCGTMTEALDGLGLELASPSPMDGGGMTGSPVTESPTTKKPTRRPTRSPTKEPTPEPTPVPTEESTEEPTLTPTVVPTKKPVTRPTQRPSLRPVTPRPTNRRTARPTMKDAVEETSSPAGDTVTETPTLDPVTTFPTVTPSSFPTTSPTTGGGEGTLAPVIGSPSPTMIEAPSGEDTEPPTFVDSSTGGGTKAPSSDAVEETKAPSSDGTEETNAPITSDATDSPATNAPTAPTFSPAPTAPTPSPSKSPSDGSSFTGDVSIPISFTLPGGNYTAEQLEEILSGENGKFKEELKESLLELIQLVLTEEFGGSNATNTSDEDADRVRVLSNASFPANVTIDSVNTTDCPEGSDTSSTCLNYDTTIILSVLNGTGLDQAAFTEKFQNAFKAKLESGWLAENFNIEEALQPTPSPVSVPSPDASTGGGSNDKTIPGESKLDTPAIIGICVGGTFLLYVLIAMFYHAGKRRQKSDEEFDLERQVGSDTVEKDLKGPSSQDASDSWSLDDASEAQTKSYSSQDHLLPEHQMRSTAEPMLGNLEEEEDWSESDVNDSTFDSGTLSSGPAHNLSAGSTLAAVGMASTFVAANSGVGSPEDLNESRGTDATDASGDVLGAESSDKGGMGVGTAAAIGAVTAGALAAGAYAATKDNSSSEEAAPQKRATDTSQSNLDELDSAIEAGNWGAVGAIAAILASSGYPGKKEPRSASSIKSEDSSAKSGSRDSSNGPTLDQARATEIDKLVEAGDWQGVVLAAARFEADQTMDGESYSASASKSSYRSGSAQSSATPRSIATSGQSSTNIGSGRSQAEIKAEIEALVRRVVPEEADNVDEMLTQFKGREEELVETLRRMQERAIASRARLAVQKSAKLEARARAHVPAPMASSASVGSRASTKSELEAAIEAGNWEAVGQAAQKMSDGSIAALSMEERARLKEKASASPALALSPGSSNEEYNLDALIERGDWPGVIAAAKKASEGTRSSTTGNMTQEEQDALAQANMWQEIANQSKQEGRQGPAGADDAAAWAISRSLSALNAPQDGPVRTIEDMADEESSEASQYESSSYSASKSHSLDADYYRHGI